MEKYNLEIFKDNNLKKSNKKFIEDMINTLLEERTTKKDKEQYILELQYVLVQNAYFHFELKEQYEKMKAEYNKLNELRKYILKYKKDIN